MGSLCQNWKLGMQRLAPGVYVDRNGALHLDTFELCVSNGYPPTPENQLLLEQVARELITQRPE